MPDQAPRRFAKANLIASFRHAMQGLWYVVVCERNARIHLLVALCVLAISAWLGLAPNEWAIVIIAVALVFAGEMLNTVVELVVDMITLEPHPLAKRAKDVAAGAVLVAATASVAVGVIVLGPHVLAKLGLR